MRKGRNDGQMDVLSGDDDVGVCVCACPRAYVAVEFEAYMDNEELELGAVQGNRGAWACTDVDAANEDNGHVLEDETVGGMSQKVSVSERIGVCEDPPPPISVTDMYPSSFMETMKRNSRSQ